MTDQPAGSGAGRRRVSTGVEGLDGVLFGGLPADRLYLLEGAPGTGKTTLALQFLMAGRAAGERGLYITLSEASDELHDAAHSHGWSLDGIEVMELIDADGLDPDSDQSILHPSEVELGETMRELMARVEQVNPSLVVIDSLSEMRMLAQSPLRHRRQVLALKYFFSRRACTVMLLDDLTIDQGDLQLHSIAHGVISLEQLVQDVGEQRRRLRVMKMRGMPFRGGYHDFNLEKGGLRVFQRLVAAEHRQIADSRHAGTGSAQLDALLGGGLLPGTNTLLNGPSGIGKTTTAIRCMLTALERGERAAYYLFDEGLSTLLLRSRSLGMDLQPYMASGQLRFTPIDPAELSPGEFAHRVQQEVESGIRFIVIDSLNAYLQAMPGERFLLLQMHELLSYLNQRQVITLLVLGQHGVVGEIRTDLDLSYLSDAIILYRFFEAQGEVRTAISVVKSRTAAHERVIREFRLRPDGLHVGAALRGFTGVLTGTPRFDGSPGELGEPAGSPG